MQTFVLALDLVNNAGAIAEYETYHQSIWPEIKESILSSGITDMKIYRVENRLVMIMETEDGFSFDKKTGTDKQNLKVQEWENLMWKYQQQIPCSKVGEKWRLMKLIFNLRKPTF